MVNLIFTRFLCKHCKYLVKEFVEGGRFTSGPNECSESPNKQHEFVEEKETMPKFISWRQKETGDIATLLTEALLNLEKIPPDNRTSFEKEFLTKLLKYKVEY